MEEKIRKIITVRAPLTTAVIIQKKNFGQQGAATNQERLQFKKKFRAIILVHIILQSLAKKLDFFQTQFGKHVVALVIGKVQKCFIPHLKALKVIFNFQCQNFPKA